MTIEALKSAIGECALINDVNDVNVAPDAQIFPNPANNRLTVRWAQNWFDTVSLIDATGRELRRESVVVGQGEHTLSVTTLPAGVYYLRLSGRRGSQVKEVVIR